MRDFMTRDRLIHRGRAHGTQADMRSGDDRDRPREAPAVAMEHRQRPQIHRMLAEIARQNIADGIEISAAVMGHDALRVTRGARGIAQRNRVPFIAGKSCSESRITRRDRRLVFELADPLAACKCRVVDVDDKGFWARHQRQRFGDHAGEFGIDENDFRAAMVELESDRGRIEPDVQCIQHRARHRDRKMHFVHGRDIRQHCRDRVAVSDATPGEPGRKASAALVGLGPGETAAFIDRADVIGVNGGAACEETQRRQRHIVRRRLFQSDRILVLGCAHRLCPI